MSHLDEFGVIGAYFKRANSLLAQQNSMIDLGIGDDAALFRVVKDHQCVVSSDMLIENRHFFADVAPRTLGHKALAVNLSDLAAMGAQPLGLTLSIGLPKVDEVWLAEFSAGLFALADEFNCPLIGGDTTRSPIVVINITIFGQVPTGQAILRSGAQVGDAIYVTGKLGAPACAVDLLKKPSLNDEEQTALALARPRLEQPQPRVLLAKALRESGLVTSMLDISDGLTGDLPHILKASGVVAQIDLDALPLHTALNALPKIEALRYATSGGDEYELCFTVRNDSPKTRSELQSLSRLYNVPITLIGQIVTTQGTNDLLAWTSAEHPNLTQLVSQNGMSGYNHFKSDQ